MIGTWLPWSGWSQWSACGGKTCDSLGTRSHTRTRNKFSRENENHVDNQTISEQCSMPECPGNIDYFM